MKHSERFFKFPVKVYHGKDWAKVEKDMNQIQEGLDMEVYQPPYAKGWERVLPEDIVAISSSISVFSSIEEGINMSEIHTRNGKSFISIWNPDKFMEKLDAFVDQLDDKEFAFEEMKTEQIRIMLENKLGEIKQQYAEQGITLNLENDNGTKE